MADRMSARLFAEIFTTLRDMSTGAGLSPIIARDVAAEFWELLDDYDFHPYQMECDEVLIALHLAEKKKSGRVFYRGEHVTPEELDEADKGPG